VITWGEFQKDDPHLAALAEGRMIGQVAYLATVRKNGAPRVHPVTPQVHDGQMFVRMYPTSPKVRDLQREPRFSLHSQVDDTGGAGGEILIAGTASLTDDPRWIKEAFDDLSDSDPSRYVVFLMDVDEVRVTLYENGETIRKRWPGPR
jgi:general stress protein 26